MVEHAATTSSQREPQPDAGSATASLGPAWGTAILANRRAKAVVGVATLALIALALGVPARTLLFFGVLLICPLMMVGMHGAHGRHRGHHGGEDAETTGANGAEGDRALGILRERYARGELTRDQYEDLRRDLG